MSEFNAEAFVDQLLSPEALNTPCDTVDPNRLELELPPWFDEHKFNRGRKVYFRSIFVSGVNFMFGIIAVFAVPSIVRILASTHRSSSSYTAYARYLNTYLYITSWVEHELKPGSFSWKSFHSVRRGHLVASRSENLKGTGIISQRDLSLTLFGLIGYLTIRPDCFGMRAIKKNDWEDLLHCFKVAGYMLGTQDRYNIVRDSYEETYQVFVLINERVFRPSLENPPEYFEHIARSFLDGIWSMLPAIDTEALLFFTKYLAGVPGYIYTEEERTKLCRDLRKHLKGKPDDTGVPVTVFLSKKCVESLPNLPPRLLYLKDYEVLDQTPAYAYLRCYEKFKLNLYFVLYFLYRYSVFKFFLNMVFYVVIFTLKYFPIFAFLRFGFKKSYSNLLHESPMDNAENKPNSYYRKSREPETWFQAIKSFLW